MDAIEEVLPDVYDLTLEDDEARYRAYLFNGPTPTLVEAGFKRTSDTLLTRLDDLGILLERLVVTHDHPDHIGGYDAVVERYDPTTYLPAESTPSVATAPDKRFSHGDAVGPFTAVHVPGHTNDNYTLVDEERGVAVMGDAVIGADWRGLPAGYFVLVEGIYSKDVRAAERNIERLQNFEFDAGLVFHGSSVYQDAREKLDAYIDFPNKPDSWEDAP